MDKNPQEANNLFDDGHPTINRLMLAGFEKGKRDGYLGAPYWVYDANNMAYREALPDQPNDGVLIEELERIDEFDESIRTVVPADHFLEEEHQQSIQ